MRKKSWIIRHIGDIGCFLLGLSSYMIWGIWGVIFVIGLLCWKFSDD